MRTIVCKDANALGQAAAKHVAQLLNEAISQNDHARLLVSTGKSQFTMFEALVQEDVDWQKVELFHLDEYLGMPDMHPASFVKYLKERFAQKVNLGATHFIDGTADVQSTIEELTQAMRKAPIDVGLIGIGENGHIAFNDPPADFDDHSAYKIVTLDEACRRQQLGEGWFPTLADVPTQAISMTVHQILQCTRIVSVVPYSVKAQAVYNTFRDDSVTNLVPATAFKLHGDVTVYLDEDSAALLNGKKS